jgi:L-threonylcarbamoyladenylate synthase
MQRIVLDLNQPQAVQQALAQTSQVLAAGGLVIYPTETVYGIGADAHSAAAIDKLLYYKGRREGKPLSVAVASRAMAAEYVDINQQAAVFYERFLPGPYTVVSKSLGRVDPRVESEFGTLGIRIPDYPLIIELVNRFGRALTSTSANASGKKRPYSVADILDHLSAKQKNLIDLIIDVGTLPPNEPSVVVDTTLSTPIALRGQLQQQRAEQQQVVLSSSETETKGLAGRLLLNHWNQVLEQGLLIGLNGELGMGKTIFTKGVAEFLQIKEAISSPTYSYMNEYEFQRGQTRG